MGMSVLPGGRLRTNSPQGLRLPASSRRASKGILVVGITDHHDASLVPYIQEAAEWSETSVLVYPRVEITCADDAQAIVIVDTGQIDFLKKLLLMLPGVMPSHDHDEHTCQPTTWTVAELHAAVADDPVLQGCLRRGQDHRPEGWRSCRGQPARRPEGRN